MITDTTHLDKVIQSIVLNASKLANAWMDEEQSVGAPKGQGDGPGSPGHSDPTFSVATLDRKWVQRDKLGNLLVYIARKLEQEVEERKPRTPTRKCSCCSTEMATHGGMCFSCQLFLKKMDYHCTEDIHDQRPRVRFCDCPTYCCDVCPDHAAEGRSVSERCKKRMYRSKPA